VAVLNRYGRFVFLYCAQVIRFRRSSRVIEWEGFQAGSFKLQTDKGERSEGVEKTVVLTVFSIWKTVQLWDFRIAELTR